jgi:hypothetical protein
LQPALRLAAHRYNRMKRRGYTYVMNIGPGPNGLWCQTICVAILDRFAAVGGLDAFTQHDAGPLERWCRSELGTGRSGGSGRHDSVNLNTLTQHGTVGSATSVIGNVSTFNGTTQYLSLDRSRTIRTRSTPPARATTTGRSMAG